MIRKGLNNVGATLDQLLLPFGCEGRLADVNQVTNKERTTIWTTCTMVAVRVVMAAEAAVAAVADATAVTTMGAAEATVEALTLLAT